MSLPPPPASPIDAPPGTVPEPPSTGGSGTWIVAPDRRVVIWALAAGIGFDLFVSHPLGISSALALVAVMVAVNATGWRPDPVVAGLLASAATLASLLVLRETPWLSSLNLLGTLALMTVAVAVQPGDVGLAPALTRVARATPVIRSAMRAPRLLFGAVVNEASSLTVDRRTVGAWVRAIALTVPTAVVLVALLASADAVFASYVTIPADPVGLGRHGFVIAFGSALALGAVAVKVTRPAEESKRWTGHLGPVEAGSILGTFALVEAAFIASQAAAILGGADYVQDTTGLTYAEYARTGFFQLLAAAGLALVVMWSVDGLTRSAGDSTRRWVTRLGVVVAALTIAIVAVSIRRLALYEDEFGLTMLRLFTTVFAAWLAVVFVVAVLHLVRGRGSLLRSIAVSAVAGLIAMNAINPEAVVARRNIERFAATGRLDVAYLVDDLGPDAADVLYDHPATRAVLCTRPAPEADPWLTLNFGRHRAATAHAEACG